MQYSHQGGGWVTGPHQDRSALSALIIQGKVGSGLVISNHIRLTHGRENCRIIQRKEVHRKGLRSLAVMCSRDLSSTREQCLGAVLLTVLLVIACHPAEMLVSTREHFITQIFSTGADPRPGSLGDTYVWPQRHQEQRHHLSMCDYNRCLHPVGGGQAPLWGRPPVRDPPGCGR